MTFEAKYDGTCAVCQDPIEPGQDIETFSSGRFEQYKHAVCPRTADVVCSICGDKWVECDCP